MHKLASGLNSLRGGLENLSLGGSPGGGAGGGGGGGPSFGGGGGGSNIEAGTIFAVEGRSYRVVKRLAEGGFAFVFLVQEISTGQPFALKRIMVQDQEHLKIVNNEISLLRKYGGPDKPVIGLFGSSTIQRDRFGTETVLVTEYCENGSLLDLMLRRIQTKLREDEIFAIFTKVCEAVHYLHSQDPPVAHRDLKVENVLMHRNGMLKLGDFGSATTRTYLPKAERDRAEADEDIQKNTTLFYRSPEMVDLYKGELINEKCDIWALGCLLFKLAFYVDAFDGALGILNCSYRVPEPCPYSSKLTAFIAYLLDEDPYKRPDIYSVLKRLGVSVQRPKHAQKRSKPDLKSSRDGSRSDSKRQSSSGQKKSGSHGSRGSRSRGSPPPSSQAEKKESNVATVGGMAVGGDLFSMLDWHSNTDSSSTIGSSVHAVTASPRNSPNQHSSQSQFVDNEWSPFSSSPTPPSSNQTADSFFLDTLQVATSLSRPSSAPPTSNTINHDLFDLLGPTSATNTPAHASLAKSTTTTSSPLSYGQASAYPVSFSLLESSSHHHQPLTPPSSLQGSAWHSDPMHRSRSGGDLYQQGLYHSQNPSFNGYDHHSHPTTTSWATPSSSSSSQRHLSPPSMQPQQAKRQSDPFADLLSSSNFSSSRNASQRP
ncbi:AP2-associated protein kinase 1 [Balamuthia mandrillaris]